MGTSSHTQEPINERFDFAKHRSFAFRFLIAGLVLLVLGIFTMGTGSSKHDDHHGGDSHSLKQTETVIHQVQDDHGEGTHGEEHAEGGHHLKPYTKWSRFWTNLLLNNFYFFTLAVGPLIFLALNNVGNAGWHITIKRIPEAMTTWLPISFIGFIILFLGMNDLYEWAYLEKGADDLIDLKRAYLNKPFFMVRNLIFFAGWGFMAWRLRKLSLNEDQVGGLDNHKKSITLSAILIIFFALSYSLFTVDWIKSLEAHWFSTVFMVYIFAGTMLSSFFAMMALLMYFKKNGYFGYVTGGTVHDLGKFGFGFSIFWAYIWVAQFLLIWYANIPEETFYYVKRIRVGDEIYLGYKFLFFMNLIINFCTPFLIFMTRNAKRTSRIVVPLAITVLIGHWIDLFVMIMPGRGRDLTEVGLFEVIGPFEIGMFLSFAGAFMLVVFYSLSRANLVPNNSPYLQESLHHSTGVV